MKNHTWEIATIVFLSIGTSAAGQNSTVKPTSPATCNWRSCLMASSTCGISWRKVVSSTLWTPSSGAVPIKIPKRYDEASPIQRVTKDTPPMLFLHGDQDRCVSHEQALAMVTRLTELGVPAEAEIYPGKPHAWFNKDPDWRVTIERVEPFLKRYFQLK